MKSRADVVAAVVHVVPSVDCSMRYEVTIAPPFEDGAIQVRVTKPSPATVATVVGAPGVVAGVAKTGSVAAPAPALFVVRIRNAYVVPFVKPVVTYDVVAVVAMRVHGPAEPTARSTW